MEKHSRPRSPPPPPPPPPPAQPPPLPAGTRKATPPPPPTSPVKQSVPIVPLLLLSMMVPKKEKSPDPSVSPPAVSPFPLSVWPTLLHSPPAVVPPPQSPVSIPDSISSSLHSQNALDRNQIVPVCPSEVDAQDTFASMPPLPADVFTGEDSSSSSVIIISPPPPAVPRPTTMPHSNEQLRAFPVPAPWPTSLELPFIPLPSGESRVLKKVESVSPQPQRTFASVGFFPENVADIPLPDAPPPPLCNGLSIPLPPRSLLSAPGSSLNNPVESYHSDEGEFLTSSNLVVDMDLDEDSAEERMIEITENVQNMM
ncbi:Protein of unknown function [Gryllus bimaculatus]|nr:Protein of unknown function [Gryllus bimaculatus]